MSKKLTYEELEQRVHELEMNKTSQEQNRLEQFIENIQVGVVVHDSDGAVIKSNAVAEAMLGLTEAQMLGKALVDPAWTFLRRDGSPMPVTEYPVSQVIVTQKPVHNVTAGIQRSDKVEPTWVLDTAIPEFDENGRIRQIITTFMDITALKNSEEKYRNLFEYVMHEVHLWKLVRDAHGSIKTWRLVEANPAALKSWSKTRSEVIGKTANEIFSYATTEHFMPIVKKIFAENTPYTWDTYFPPTAQFLHMTSVPFGEYFISTGTDITERKQAEQALEETLTDLRLAQQIANIGNWQFDPEVGVPVWSKAIYAIYERDPALGPPHVDEYTQIYDEAQYAIFSAAFQRAVRAGIPYDIELMLKLPQNRVKWVHALCQPNDEQGNAGYFLRGTIQDITARKQLEVEKDTLITELERALAKVKKLEGLLPICSVCKKIRDDQGDWQQIEKYIHERSEAKFSHGICPDCLEKQYPEIYGDND